MCLFKKCVQVGHWRLFAGSIMNEFKENIQLNDRACYLHMCDFEKYVSNNEISSHVLVSKICVHGMCRQCLVVCIIYGWLLQ